MAGTGQHPGNGPEGMGPQLHRRPALQPRDFELHEGDHVIDLHPQTYALVPSEAPYVDPQPLRGPDPSVQGQPPPRAMTTEALGFQPRMPLQLVFDKKRSMSNDRGINQD